MQIANYERRRAEWHEHREAEIPLNANMPSLQCINSLPWTPSWPLLRKPLPISLPAMEWKTSPCLPCRQGSLRCNKERIPHPWPDRGLLIFSDDTSFSPRGFSSPRWWSTNTHTRSTRRLPGQHVSAWDEWREEEDEITGVLFRCCSTEALDFPSQPDKLMRSILLRGSEILTEKKKK